jgi:SAM-dependent methyltransferase
MAKTAVAGLNTQLVEIAMGYQRSRALCAAARLGVADALGDSERTITDLAAICKADVSALHRLLRALAGMGVVRENTPGSFVLTDFGKPLRKDVPDSAWAAVIFWADLLAENWACLTDCVRTGKTASAVRPEIKARWTQDPEASSVFRAVMGTSPAEDYMPIARAWDFSAAGTVADLGGGGGVLIEAILETFPAARGMLVDRSESIEAARPRFASSHLAGRCELISADLIQEVPRGADVYVLKHVLHGYTDAMSVDILRNCRSVLPPDGRVLIIEFTLPNVIDRADRDLESRLMSDLNMLAVTQGKERSALEWTSLLDRAGFRCERIIPVAGDLVSIIEARPQ